MGDARAIDRAKALLRELEGLRLVPYRDAGGWSVGYGHWSRDKPIPLASEAEAEAMLCADVAAADRELAGVALTEGQRVALISFVYNVGAAAWRGSTLRRLMIERRAADAAREFGRWVHVGKVGDPARRVVPALVDRRRREARIFTGAE